jgi:hypothetical protein
LAVDETAVRDGGASVGGASLARSTIWETTVEGGVASRALAAIGVALTAVGNGLADEELLIRSSGRDGVREIAISAVTAIRVIGTAALGE